MDHVVIGPAYSGAAEPRPSGAGNRHERRRRRTHRLIFDTAVRLFLEQGYEATTIEQIADAADVARATVFNHFPRKADIVGYWAGQRVAALHDLWQTRGFRERSVEEQLLAFLQVLAAMNERERRISQIMMGATVRAGFPLAEEWQLIGAHAFTEAVRLGQQRGEIDPDTDTFEAGELIRGAYLDTLYRWLQGEDEPPFALGPALIRKARMVLYGISTRKPASVPDGKRDGNAPAKARLRKASSKTP
jgi:AcrR family transcriptional regulator